MNDQKCRRASPGQLDKIVSLRGEYMWKVTFYNGTIWESKTMMEFFEAINLALKENNLHSMDIKSVVNMH